MRRLLSTESSRRGLLGKSICLGAWSDLGLYCRMRNQSDRWRDTREACVVGWAWLRDWLIGYLIRVIYIVNGVVECPSCVKWRQWLYLWWLIWDSDANHHLVISLRRIDRRVGLLFNNFLYISHSFGIKSLSELLHFAIFILFLFRIVCWIRTNFFLVEVL